MAEPASREITTIRPIIITVCRTMDATDFTEESFARLLLMVFARAMTKVILQSSAGWMLTGSTGRSSQARLPVLPSTPQIRRVDMNSTLKASSSSRCSATISMSSRETAI